MRHIEGLPTNTPLTSGPTHTASVNSNKLSTMAPRPALHSTPADAQGGPKELELEEGEEEEDEVSSNPAVPVKNKDIRRIVCE